MSWRIEFLPEAVEDMRRLDGSTRARVAKAIEKVSASPYPQSGDPQGRVGYGKPLGNRRNYELAGLMKVKLRGDGIRVVYKLVEREGSMLVIVIGLRSDEEVYAAAAARRLRHGL